VYESVPVKDIQLVSEDLPVVYLDRLLNFIGSIAMESPHLEFNVKWIQCLVTSHGKYISSNKHQFASSIRLLQRFLNRIAKDVVDTSKRNGHLASYLQSAQAIEEKENGSMEDGESEEEDDDDDDDMNGEEESDEEGWIVPEKKMNGVFKDEEEGLDDSDEN
jgi:periodic tryptophan protein 2